MRNIGLHVRLVDSLIALGQRAMTLQLPTFQCFFVHQHTHAFIKPSRYEIVEFAKLRSSFNDLFVHASYWTNFASIEDISLRAFERELSLAKRLDFNYIIIHPGSAKGAQHRMEGIEALVRRLNKILKHEHAIKIILENTAHAKLSIGGDLHDFKMILEKCDYPDKVSFCLDTAHAYVYGYPLATVEDQQLFFTSIEQTIGFERIALIHLNNTNQPVGSYIDKHTTLKQGLLSIEELKRLVLYDKLAKVPIIMELPIVSDAIEQETVQLVRSWH